MSITHNSSCCPIVTATVPEGGLCIRPRMCLHHPSTQRGSGGVLFVCLCPCIGDWLGVNGRVGGDKKRWVEINEAQERICTRTYAHRCMHIRTCIHTFIHICIHTVNKFRFTGLVPFLRAKTVAKVTVANENCHKLSHITDLTCIVLCVGLVGRAA